MANSEKKAKPSFMERVKAFFHRIKMFFVNMWHELKKVTWPSWKDVLKYSLVVFIFMVAMGIIIGVIDLGSGALIDLIMKL